MTEEYNRDRRDLEDTQQELLKELKLKYLMIENFIPPAEKKKLLSRSTYDEEEDTWYLTSPGQTTANTISKRPVSAAGSRRPMSEYARTLSLSVNGASGSRYSEIQSVRYIFLRDQKLALAFGSMLQIQRGKHHEADPGPRWTNDEGLRRPDRCAQGPSSPRCRHAERGRGH